MYILSPAEGDSKLFFSLNYEDAARYGAIGYLRIDFGRDGREFWYTWFDLQADLNTADFKYEFDDVINSLRDDGQAPPFASRMSLERFCSATPGIEIPVWGQGYMIRTLEHSYCFRCLPCPGDYDVYCFCYSNRLLLPMLEKDMGGDEDAQADGQRSG